MLLELTVKNCHFLFNGVLYQQVDGVAMGCPLGPLFSNIFLSLHEGCWLDNCPTSFKPLFYHHYVDDCFLIFQSADHIPQFRSYFNQQHPNINFTCEVESNSTLPFLNISIMRTGGRFETSVYQTPTFTGLFTNFHSFIPSQYKPGADPGFFVRRSRFFDVIRGGGEKVLKIMLAFKYRLLVREALVILDPLTNHVL